MKKRTRLIVTLCLVLLSAAAVRFTQAQEPLPQNQSVNAKPMSNAFTYQGYLRMDGRPVNNVCDFQFSLWNTESGGTQIGLTQSELNVNVSDGLFNLALDFGAEAFDGNARWLEIRVRCPAGSGSYTTLQPRQALTVVPYALYARSAPWSGLTDVPPDFADGVDNDTIYTAGIGLTLNNGQFHVAFAGTGNANAVARSDHNHDENYWTLTGNQGITQNIHFLGTTDNQPLEFRVDNTRALRLEPHSSGPNFIGGHEANSVSTGVGGATISGGGADGGANQVTDDYGSVGGGYKNQAGNGDATLNDAPYTTVAGGRCNAASGSHATVGGGEHNIASGSHATVGGGLYNLASGYAAVVGGGGGFDDVLGNPLPNTASGSFSAVSGGIFNAASGFGATIAGGEGNHASGEDASIGGGWQNSAYGFGATVPGGAENSAVGDYSFAAGRKAKANHKGAFVWGDSSDADVSSERMDQFRVRANGGVRFDLHNNDWVNMGDSGNGRLIDSSTGAYLSNSGVWTNACDRALKENFSPVDNSEILLRLAKLPIATWNYRAEALSVRHIGPVAQDFFALFGLGEDDTHISTIDAEGIALAGIQGLYELALEQAGHIQQLEVKNAVLEQRIAALEALVAALMREQAVRMGH